MPATKGFPDWSVRTPTTEQIFSELVGEDTDHGADVL
jgi:hypothetical protein